MFTVKEFNPTKTLDYVSTVVNLSLNYLKLLIVVIEMDLYGFIFWLLIAVAIRTVVYYGLMQIFDSMFGCFIIFIDFIVSLFLMLGTEATGDPVFLIPLTSLLLMFVVFAAIIGIKKHLDK